MGKVILIFAVITGLFTGASAQAQENYNTTVPRDIIIIKSTKNYRTALAAAKGAARRLHKTLDLRRLHPDNKLGLTLSLGDTYSGRTIDPGSYPYYPARGDGLAASDDYISVEYSNAYKGFAKGYYLVVAAIGSVRSAAMKTQLARINKVYPDAYAKRTSIWFGTLNE
ncbi:MAG: hypothetical protein ACXVJD_04735 [Mucilaginibacter sp.]